MERVILHCDMNGFFASVESLYYPEHRGKPLAVCGDPAARHGIILAKNEEAKKYGIVTAETIYSALKKCPELCLVPPHFDRYEKASSAANEIYRRFTDLVEPFSIDESFLDVSGSTHLFGDGKTIADTLRHTVREELGLTISVGVSFNKIFAKLGSDYKKPDATTVITRENYKHIVWPLPVDALMYAGRSTVKKLRQIGVNTIGDLAAQDLTVIRTLLGKNGEALWRSACGQDNSPVRVPGEEDEVKSVGKGLTFSHDLTTEAQIAPAVLALCESVGQRLRALGMRCGGVQVKLRDPDFKDIDRQMHLERPTCATREIAAAAMELIRRNHKNGDPLRMITVTAIALESEKALQLSLYEEDQKGLRQEALDHSLDRLRERFGRSAVQPASLLTQKLPDSKEDS